MYPENPKNTPAPKGAFPGAGSDTTDFYTRLQKREPVPGKVLGGGKLGGRAASYKRCPPSEVFLFLNKRYRKAKVSDIFRLEHVRFLDIQKRPVKASRGINNVPGKPQKHACPERAFPGAGSGKADFYTQLQKREPAPGKVLGGGRLGGRANSYKRCPPSEVFSFLGK